MNIEKYLILIKQEDVTEDVIRYEYQSGLVNVIFKASDKVYSYSRSDFKFYKEPRKIDVDKCYVLILGGHTFNIDKVLEFTDYYKIFFKDNTIKIIPYDQVKLVPRNTNYVVSTNKFQYFKDISEIVGIKTENGTAILTNEYNKINCIERDTVLYKYLNSEECIKKNTERKSTIIYPFGSNSSQFSAVKNAMENQISIIEGPPGTGKTQIILNIIANIVRRGKTVAIVSNNNSATENVYEKLKKYDLDFLCAKLGKNSNKVDFIENQTGHYPNFNIELDDREQVEEQIDSLNSDIVKIFSLRNEVAILRDELSQLQTEHDYFNRQEYEVLKDMPKIRSLEKISAKQIMNLKVECEDLEARNEKINLLFKIKSALLLKTGDLRFYNKDARHLTKIYNKLFFIVRELEIKEKINICNRQLRDLDYKKKIGNLTNYSMKLLKDFIRAKYRGKNQRPIFNMSDFTTSPERVNKEYPIILSTTHSIKNCFESNYKFDYIIMDEASQVDLITGVLTMSSAKNAVIVGDLKQLPNVITGQDASKIERISKKYNIGESYNYLKNSFLSSMIKTIKDVPDVMLKEHYRCHPKIIGFCNKKFYDNQLIIMTEDNGENDVLKAYVTAEGNHARGHYNQRQIDVIEQEVLPELEAKVQIDDIGIISPYREQKQNLDKRIDNIQVDTVHKFQGREKEAIVITTVDNEISDFVDDPKMLNVAITRAKRYLRVVVSDNKENEGTNLDDLIKYIQYNNFEVKKSQIKSIYDLLYKQNMEQRLEYLKGKKRISEYDSENVTYSFINDLIKENNFDNLDVAVHVPLSDVLDGLEKLAPEEWKFVNKTWTHIDFVIFNKMDKKTVIAVEVDGYFYHKEGTAQEKRDKVKDRILEKYGIPLVRLGTIGSNERKILEQKMETVFRKSGN